MPKIFFEGKEMSCKLGANLRESILKNGSCVHNGNSKFFNCLGFGTCGTCAVKIKGDVNEMTIKEKLRLDFPPHKITSGLRLACQVKVMGNIEVEKHEGFWGQKTKTDFTKGI